MAIVTNELKLGGYLIAKLVSLGKTSTGSEYASVRLTLQVGEEDGQRVDLEIFANKLTSTGAENKIYTNLMTIHQEYKSLDSQFVDRRNNKEAKPVKHEATTVASKEEVDFVYANKGVKLSNNRYMSNGELVTNFRLTANFVNRAKEGMNNAPYLEGTLVGVCGKDVERMIDNNGDIVGLKLDFLVPEFRKGYTNRFGEEIADSVAVERYELVLRQPTDDALDYCEEEFVKGRVCSIGVEPMSRIEQAEVKKEDKPKRGFGNVPTFEPTTKVSREIRIIGGYALDEDEYENDEAFDFDKIGEGVKALEEKIESIKESNGKTVEVPKGFGRANKPSGKSDGMNFPF